MMTLRNNPDFFLEGFVVGPLAVNCYLVADPGTKDACIIDPGADPEKLKRAVRKNGFSLKFIINTHGHGDHIAANGSFDVPIYIHRLDADFLIDPAKNLSKHFFFTVKSPAASRILEDGDVIALGDLEFRVVHTPGHTPGSIVLALGSVLFTGDTLFCGGVGRTDFDYGDEKTLYNSIRKKIFTFPDDTVIYPGHGSGSTIGAEKGAI